MINGKTGPRERRKLIRLEVPIAVTYLADKSDTVRHVTTKNISAYGLMFQGRDKNLGDGGTIELKLDIPEAINPVHAKGKVAWKRKVSLEDNAPSDIGIEFSEIEEDNKNTFLKFLCDQMYELPKGHIHVKEE